MFAVLPNYTGVTSKYSKCPFFGATNSGETRQWSTRLPPSTTNAVLKRGNNGFSATIRKNGFFEKSGNIGRFERGATVFFRAGAFFSGDDPEKCKVDKKWAQGPILRGFAVFSWDFPFVLEVE